MIQIVIFSQWKHEQISPAINKNINISGSYINMKIFFGKNTFKNLIFSCLFHKISQVDYLESVLFVDFSSDF